MTDGSTRPADLGGFVALMLGAVKSSWAGASKLQELARPANVPCSLVEVRAAGWQNAPWETLVRSDLCHCIAPGSRQCAGTIHWRAGASSGILVSQFRSSHHCAAPRLRTSELKDTSKLLT